MLFADLSGNLVFAKAVDLQHNRDATLPDTFWERHIASSRLLEISDLKQGITGIVMTDDKPVLVAAKGILKNDQRGSPNGSDRWLTDSISS